MPGGTTCPKCIVVVFDAIEMSFEFMVLILSVVALE
jgi:hypothetical protein